jgi:DNA helicase-2/ATP-dependent DNA helicase PcrA
LGFEGKDKACQGKENKSQNNNPGKPQMGKSLTFQAVVNKLKFVILHMRMTILGDLNPVQQMAVRFSDGPLLILAGAGSGKTRVLTYRTAYLISEAGIDPENILLLTFTNKAAEEMLRRVKTLLKSQVSSLKSQIIGGTFHSFCVKVLRRNAAEAGVDPNFVIFDEADQLETVKQAMEKVGADPKSVRPGSLLGAISGAKNELISPSEYSGFARGNFAVTVAQTYLVYQQLLAKYRALDFDDLLMVTVKLLKNHPEVTERLQKKFLHVLVDEYQDTNKAQYEITKMLTRSHRQLTVVGDAAQAIYSWRGADYRNLLLLKQDFPDLTTINLEQNYRSTQVILDAAFGVISRNKKHPILKLWTDRPGGRKITVYETENETEEAQFVLQQIMSRVQGPGSSYHDFAVLYRTNAQSRVLEEALLHAGIPYVLVGGVRFYERKEIKDVVAYLRLLINPNDEVARKRAEKLGKTKLKKYDIRFMNYEFSNKNTLNILDEVLKETDYLNQYDPLNEEDAGRLENIKELRSVATEFPDLVDFLTQIALTEKESKSRVQGPALPAGRQGSSGSVTLMTVHAAKGLEFKNVFMVGMEEGLFPHSRSLLDSEQMEEERRLCYVGMTRAMDKLYLIYARMRLFFGTRSANVVSRFVGEIPEHLIEMNEVPSSLKLRRAQWGFDEQGNWKWKPDEDVNF